jgi:CBS domain-containing protein
MQIKDRPEFKRKTPVLTFGPDESVASAVKVMSERNFGATVIVNPDNTPLGIVTERDFMRRLLDKGLDPHTTKLGDIMTTQLKTARADDDLLSWMQQMSNDRFRHLPVVDEQGKLISMMSQGDFVAYTWPQLMNRVTETAKAAFDVNPSIFIAIGGVIIFMLAVLIMFAAIA